jgi:hypothetical protein
VFVFESAKTLVVPVMICHAPLIQYVIEVCALYKLNLLAYLLLIIMHVYGVQGIEAVKDTVS